MASIFVTHPPAELAEQYGERALAGLRALGEVRLNTAGRELTQEELVAAAAGCSVIVSYRQTPATVQVFRSLPELVAITRCAVDIRNIDIPAASAQGVLVTHASAGFIPAVAEWVVAVMVDLSRGITAATEAYHAGRTPKVPPGRELRGATLGVLGYGQISKYLCDIALALGMKVLVTDPYAKVDRSGLQQVPLAELLAGSDHVVSLALATAETENIFDAAAFNTMKRGAYFINASRGSLVDEAALLDALERGWVAGCAMDVGRAPDNMPTPALAAHPRVIATPHVGAYTPASVEHQAMETVEQVAQILSGRAPAGALNAEHATRLQQLMPSSHS